MKTQVFVLLPQQVAPSDVRSCAEKALNAFQSAEEPRPPGARFDYAVGNLSRSLHDSVASGLLPAADKRALEGSICLIGNLKPDVIPAALVTPDGRWHDLGDFGWRMTAEGSAANDLAMQHWTARFRELVREHPHGWLLECWVHS